MIVYICMCAYTYIYIYIYTGRGGGGRDGVPDRPQHRAGLQPEADLTPRDSESPARTAIRERSRRRLPRSRRRSEDKGV